MAVTGQGTVRQKHNSSSSKERKPDACFERAKILVLWKRVQNRRTKMLSVKLDRYDKKDVLLLMNYIRLSNRENLSY